MLKVKLFFILIVVLCAGICNACDPCALYSALNVNKNGEGTFSLSMLEQFTSFEKGDSDAYYSLKNGERIRDFSTTQFNISYGLTDKLSLQVSVPFIVRYLDEVKNFRSNSTLDAGIGDITLISQYANTISFKDN